MFRSIVVPLDGSAFGEQALPYAMALSCRTGAVLKLVHVHQRYVGGHGLESVAPFSLNHISDAYEAADAEARREMRDRLWEVADGLVANGIPATAHVLAGHVPSAICEFADNAVDPVVVMTTHGHSGLRRLWLGSVADAIVRHGSTPIMLVRPSEETSPPREIDFRRILVPIDGSECSNRIIGPVASLVANEEATVTFFEVCPPADDLDAILAPAWARSPRAAAGVESEGRFDGIHQRLPINLSRARMKRVVHLHPALAIMQEAEAGDYDIIAMSTHGRGGARHFLLGSTADMVLRGADIPVLIFRPPGLKREVPRTALDDIVDDLVQPRAAISQQARAISLPGT